MAIWIEIHCDVRSNGPPDRGRLHPFCNSDRNENISGMTGNSRAVFLKTIRHLEKNAKSAGWVKTRDGWICSSCITMIRRLEA